MYELKPLSRESVPGALAKAERYRLLNEPMEAESICRDILEVDAGNQQALISLVLALTDQIAQDHHAFSKAVSAAGRLTSLYDQAYYSGICWERRAKARFQQGGHGMSHVVYDWLARALDLFHQAEAVRPSGNDDALLRSNTCVRFLRAHPELKPAEVEAPVGIASE